MNARISELIDAAGALCRVVVSAADARDDIPSDAEARAIENLRRQIKLVLDESGGHLGMTVTPLPICDQKTNRHVGCHHAAGLR